MSKVKDKSKKSKKKAERKKDRLREADAAEQRRRFQLQADGAAAARRNRKRKTEPILTHHPAHGDVVKKWRGTEPPPALELDARGHRRPAATLPGAGRGRVPASKGRTYMPQALATMDVVSLLRQCADTPSGHRLRAWIAFSYRTGVRVAESLNVYEDDLKPRKGSIRVRKGKGGKNRIVSMDPWGWDECAPWLAERKRYTPGPVFCVLEGPTAGWRPWGASQVRWELHRLAKDAGLRCRVHPHAFRHTFSVEWIRAGLPLHLLQKQLGHADLRVTTRYLVSICHEDLLAAAFKREAPGVPVPDLMEALARG